MRRFNLETLVSEYYPAGEKYTVEMFLVISEMIGTVAFAISGAVLGLRKRMDLFGVIILGVTTAVGGGAIRDIVLGRIPPAVFRDPKYALCAIGVSVFLFLPCVNKVILRHKSIYRRVLLIADSIGLGIFVVNGVSISVGCAQNNLFLAAFVGTITGVGGGMMRDVLAGDTPFILVEQVYACAAIVGAAACYLLWPVLGARTSMLIGMAIVIVMRLLAAYYHWNLPRASFDMEE